MTKGKFHKDETIHVYDVSAHKTCRHIVLPGFNCHVEDSLLHSLNESHLNPN